MRGLALASLTACQVGVFDPNRPFDLPLECAAPGTAVYDTLDDAIASADFDGDGLLTAADARPGEMVLVLQVTGTHRGTGIASAPGYTVHSDLSAEWLVNLRNEYGVEAYALNCQPYLSVWVYFDGVPSEPQVADLVGASAAVIPIEVATDDTGSRVEGVLHITAVDGERRSGHMEGRLTLPLLQRIPDEARTGQTLFVEALAFREVGP